jgi:hypothetical protein
MNDKTLTIERRITRLEKAVFGQKGEDQGRPKSEAKASDFSGPTGGIRLLVSQNFFKTRKSLADVRTALAKNDYHYVTQVIHNFLSRLSRVDGPLVSVKDGNKKMYVKRK